MDIVIKNNKLFNQKKNKFVIDKVNIDRVKNLKIPPGYHNVKINTDPNFKIQATGYDSMNRKQYIYHKNYLEAQSELKFTDLIHFGKKIKRIRQDITKNVNNPDDLLSKTKVISIMLYLMDRCHFRIGSVKYKKLYDTYGVTTLNTKHLYFKKKHLEIKFKGKKNVINISKISNVEAIEYLKFLCYINQDNEYIFYYKNSNPKIKEMYHITDKHINSYLQEYHHSLTAKMFRTWSANSLLLKFLLESNIPKDKPDAVKIINKIIANVAEKLHHTKKVSKKSYINNQLIQLYLSNFKVFYQIIEKSKKSNGSLPTIDRLLNIFLTYISSNK